jgi:predicted O-methyltransferase YrrM
MITLHEPQLRHLLDRLYADAAKSDGAILPGLIADARQQGILDDSVLAPKLGAAFMAVAPEVGRFLYQLVRIKRPAVVVEFGTSFGLSSIHLAAALRDNGTGRLITCEIEPGKVRQAAANIAAAGLADLVEIREGDAFATLADVRGIDMVSLDGWKALYLPLLRQLEPALAPGSLVVADDLKVMPEKLAAYLDYVRDAANGYVSVELPIDDGVELSIR